MPSKVCVQLKDVTKPSNIPLGDTVEIDEAKGELNVKDVFGELLGSFRQASVVGWWLEGEP
jgi:hypothetical protein